MTTPWPVEWFTMRSGQRRISGWLHTAVAGRPFGICPLCFAMVPAGGDPGQLDLTGPHDHWHAANDFPDPNGE